MNIKLKDAPMGAVLRDKDGDAWGRMADGAISEVRGLWREHELQEAEDEHGPFKSERRRGSRFGSIDATPYLSTNIFAGVDIDAWLKEP